MLFQSYVSNIYGKISTCCIIMTVEITELQGQPGYDIYRTLDELLSLHASFVSSLIMACAVL